MAITSIENTSVGQQFFAPLVTVYPQSDKQHDCKSISDLEFAKLGISRCITASKTGQLRHLCGRWLRAVLAWPLFKMIERQVQGAMRARMNIHNRRAT